MKKILTAIIALIFITPNAHAISLFKKNSENTTMQSVRSFVAKKTLEYEVKSELKEQEKQIQKVLDEILNASNAHDVQTIAKHYDKSYVSYDGFKYDTFVEMMEETFKTYKDISYKSDVKNITISGDEAFVNLIDYTSATLQNDDSKKEKMQFSPELSVGYLEGVCNYVIHFKKNRGEWKIIGDTIIYEANSVKYGAAKDVKMELSAPIKTKRGEDYCVTLKMSDLKKTKAIAALGNEMIIYPSNEPKEIFRKMPSEGILERIVHPNKKGLNEYAIASIGLTKIDLLEDLSAIRFQMTGFAFLMQRVNFYDEKNPINENKKEEKEVKASVENEG